jgi:hypothetical protein
MCKVFTSRIRYRNVFYAVSSAATVKRISQVSHALWSRKYVIYAEGRIMQKFRRCNLVQERSTRCSDMVTVYLAATSIIHLYTGLKMFSTRM